MENCSAFVLVKPSCEPETNRTSFNVELTVFPMGLFSNGSRGGTSPGNTRPMDDLYDKATRAEYQYRGIGTRSLAPDIDADEFAQSRSRS